MAHTLRVAVAVLTLAALTATTSACTPKPEPTPSPTLTPSTSPTTPTTTPSLSEQDQNIAAAKNAYLAYVAAYDAAAQAGFVNRDLTIAAFELTSADAREAIVSVQTTFEQNGLRQTGSTLVRALAVTEYQADSSGAGLHGAKLRACVEPSDTDTVFADGTSTTPTDQPQYRGPRIVYVQMQRQPEGNWTVANEDPRPEERC